jgi:hypothetical protein
LSQSGHKCYFATTLMFLMTNPKYAPWQQYPLLYFLSVSSFLLKNLQFGSYFCSFWVQVVTITIMLIRSHFLPPCNDIPLKISFWTQIKVRYNVHRIVKSIQNHIRFIKGFGIKDSFLYKINPMQSSFSIISWSVKKKDERRE